MKNYLTILALVVSVAMFGASQSYAAPIKFKLAHAMTEDSFTHIAATQFFKPFVEEKSNGQIEVQIFPNAQLGSDRQTVEGVRLGTIEASNCASGAVSVFAPSFGIWDLPFIFENRAEAYKVLDGPFGQKINDTLLPVGLRNLAWLETGFRNITNNVKPITSPKDLEGLKLRTMENPIFIEAFRELGANPTPMAFGELYTGLQQGTVDGQENPITHIYMQKFYEVQKYLTISRHVYSPAVLIVNDKWFGRLPEDLQKVLVEGAKIYRDECRRIAEEQETDMLNKLKESGMIVNELTPEQKALFMEKTQGIVDVFDKDVEGGKELVEELNLAKQQ